jgi:GABA(A) receptor-associated protein
MSKFKKTYTFDKRKAESERINNKYPDRFAIIVEKNTNCKLLPDIDKNKYLVPIELTIGQFNFIIRRRLKLKKEVALFLYHDNILPPTSQTLEHFLKNKKDDDGFYYFTYTGENTFGKL